MSVREEREARQRERAQGHHEAGVGTYIFGALALGWIVAQIITRVF